jgi:hypothetical protein
VNDDCSQFSSALSRKCRSSISIPSNSPFTIHQAYHSTLWIWKVSQCKFKFIHSGPSHLLNIIGIWQHRPVWHTAHTSVLLSCLFLRCVLRQWSAATHSARTSRSTTQILNHLHKRENNTAQTSKDGNSTPISRW